MELQGALALAIAAAREAAELLRAEFHRPGGPRGPRGKCEADTEAERLLRDRLVSASGWSFLGEETGRHGDAGPLWIVDPNDGTDAFQRGMRGPAISIGLVRDGVPVLGVVFSYLAPDGEGDLFTWAEGCGPLQRNGSPVSPRRFTTLDRAPILVSHRADEAPDANAVALAPARFITMPSLAYRLALAAVGDAAAGVSLPAPSSWDCAAGHALLRGAGKVLL
ncbi:MAG: inositol monophosphatase family protein, partial [Myxococcales bacterium]